MVLGMLAKAVWDRTEEGKIWPGAPNIVRPLVVSPVVFSIFGGMSYIEELNLNMSISTLIYAFQIGFMWQHVFRKHTAQQISASNP